MKFAINQATTMSTDFETDLKSYSKAGFKAVEIWLPKLSEYLSKGGSLPQVKKMLSVNDIKPIGACYQSNLMLYHAKPKEEVMKEFSEKIEICRYLEIPVLIVPADSVSLVEEKYYEQACVNLYDAGQIAEKYNIKLAIEFLARSKFVGCISTVVTIVRKTQRKNIGILFDTFHFYCGISKIEDIDDVKGDEIFLVHLNDVIEKPREILTDKYRTFPGEGIIPLEIILKKLKKIGYKGYYSLELFNEELWKQDPYDIAKMCFESLEKFRRRL